jgi:hypothetical protein
MLESATPVQRTHVYRSGSFIRVVGICTALFLLAAMSIGLTVRFPSGSAAWTAFSALLAASVFVIVRCLRVGIWISPAGLNIRSWFKSWTLPPGSIRRCDRVPYWGMLQGAGESRFLWMVTLSLYDGRTVNVRCTLAPRRTIRRQVAQIVSYLDHETTAP